MSSYVTATKHPVTGKWENAEWMDDYFGRHQYGVRFKDGSVYHERLVTTAQEQRKPWPGPTKD